MSGLEERNTIHPIHEYLFCAEFADGSSLHQTQKDISQYVPGKNAFYDVLERQGDLVSFALVGVHPPYNVYRVSLLDGSFTVNGGDFYSHWRKREGVLSNYRLIYFSMREIDTGVGEVKIIGYMFGWQANRMDGSNIQRVHTVELR